MKMKLIWDPPKADPTLHTCRYSVRRRTFQVRSTAGLVSEWHRFLFRSESDHGCGKSKKEEHSETERLFVGEVFGQNGFNIGYSGRAQDPHLIGEAGEKAANFVGRKLVQVRGNNAPTVIIPIFSISNQKGIRHAPSAAAVTIARRRPRVSEIRPKNSPPQIAPIMEITVMVAVVCTLK